MRISESLWRQICPQERGWEGERCVEEALGYLKNGDFDLKHARYKKTQFFEPIILKFSKSYQN